MAMAQNSRNKRLYNWSLICWSTPNPVKVTNKGLDGFRLLLARGRSKSYVVLVVPFWMSNQFEPRPHEIIVARKMSTPGADGQEPTLKQHGAKDSGN